ncbi:MAG: J domain-containing protein [Oscillospiraceae bacterium]|nr:J domain-containing protein [Oscillospiraceae bacterium]
MNDPYSVLGVSPDASDEEIKTAYRKLAKQYHPDLHPGDAYAAKRMTEINAAYDQIKNPQPEPSGGFGGSGAGYAGYGGSAYRTREETERNELRAARSYIRARHFQEALTALSGVTYRERDGEWYYLHAIASYNLGNRVAAMDSARRACELSPGNMAYRQLMEQIESGSATYEEAGRGFGYQTVDLGNFFSCGRFCLPFLFCFCCNPCR